MPTLSEYTNVYNTALLILREKGYQVWRDTNAELYFAEKDGWDFAADSPCGLLGVVAIREHLAPKEYREYWWKKEGPNLYDNLLDSPDPFVSVMSRPPVK